MKLAHLYLLFGFGLATCGFTACDNLNESERFDDNFSIDDIMASTRKNVLVEDFTGQKCPNCPEATEVIHNMQQTFGVERVIGVAIHGGGLGVSEEQSPIGLANATGRDYHQYWNVQSWPKGLVDRFGGLKDHPQWLGDALTRFVMPLKVDLAVNCTYDEATRELTLRTETKGLDQADGKLQVWLTESDIVAPQRTMTGDVKDYVHNHVFRASVNDAYGDAMSVAKGEEKTVEYTYTLKENWVPAHMAVVVFFYNEAEGVLQVIDRKIMEN